MKRPNSKVNLDAAILRLAGTKTQGLRFSAIRTVVADVVVGQMLPDCVIKGGSSLKLRYGEGQTRFTLDFDTASRMELDAFIREMRRSLAEGWNDFTGTMEIERPAAPRGVPAEYVMQPFRVRLNYHGKAWYSIRLEFGHNEVGDADEVDFTPLPPDILRLFSELGFPEPKAVPLMPLKFQIAQKLHGVSAARSTRVRDLIDLQQIMRLSPVDLVQVNMVCKRLFAYRKCQAWPPEVIKGEGWEEQYAAQKYDLPVLPTVDEAIAWANNLLRRIATAQ